MRTEMEKYLSPRMVSLTVKKNQKCWNSMLTRICSLKTFGHGSWDRSTKATDLSYALASASSVFIKCFNMLDIVGYTGSSTVYHKYEVSIPQTSGQRWRREQLRYAPSTESAERIPAQKGTSIPIVPSFCLCWIRPSFFRAR